MKTEFLILSIRSGDISNFIDFDSSTTILCDAFINIYQYRARAQSTSMLQ